MSATLKFPSVLELCVIDVQTRQPVSRIGLMLTIFAPRKNNYHLAKITDGVGKARVSLAEMGESIRTDQQLFPMDYASSFEECEAEIEVKVCSPEEVKRAVAAMEMFKSVTKIDDGLLSGFKTSSNAGYVPTLQRVRLDESKNEVRVEIFIRRRSDGV
jgi:hypothetical protein